MAHLPSFLSAPIMLILGSNLVLSSASVASSNSVTDDQAMKDIFNYSGDGIFNYSPAHSVAMNCRVYVTENNYNLYLTMQVK